MFFAEGLLADLSAPVLFCGVDELIAKLEAAKEYTDLRGVSARRIGGGNLSTAGYGGMMFRLLSENSNGLLTSTTAGSLGRHYDMSERSRGRVSVSEEGLAEDWLSEQRLFYT